MTIYQMNNLRKHITCLIKRKIISVEDINNLDFLSFNDMINSYHKKDFRSEILFTIYINPYLLCDDNTLKEKPILSMEDISPLLIKRYNEEIRELKNRYYEGDYNLDQMYFMANKVRKIYFDSSLIGRRIYNIYNDNIEIISKLDKNLKFK